jgi:hypothetical protein
VEDFVDLMKARKNLFQMGKLGRVLFCLFDWIDRGEFLSLHLLIFGKLPGDFVLIADNFFLDVFIWLCIFLIIFTRLYFELNWIIITGGCCGASTKTTIVGGWAWAWWLVTDVQRMSLEVKHKFIQFSILRFSSNR